MVLNFISMNKQETNLLFFLLIPQHHVMISIRDVIEASNGYEVLKMMNNAIKHTPEGGNIEICYDSQYISIENEGKHLTTQQMKTIWETYVSHDREGTGLGLAICRTILELHHFDYGVKNTEKGVCFYIRTKE